MKSQRLAVSADEIASYHKQGFHIARGLFRPCEIEDLKSVFMTQAERGKVEHLNDDGRIQDPNDPLYTYCRMMHPHRWPDLEIGSLAMRTMLNADVGQILEALMGAEPVAAQSMFYFKPPSARGQALHQDNFYLNVEPDTCMAAWLAVDDADPENGGMFVVPGSHRYGMICPHDADPAVYFTNHEVDLPDGAEPIPALLKAGDVLFFNGSVVHGSYPNESLDRFRRAFICHYATVNSTQISHYYRPLHRFDGTVWEHTSFTEDGGPCGTLQEATAAVAGQGTPCSPNQSATAMRLEPQDWLVKIERPTADKEVPTPK